MVGRPKIHQVISRELVSMGGEPTQSDEELKLYGHESYEDVTEEFMKNAKRECLMKNKSVCVRIN